MIWICAPQSARCSLLESSCTHEEAFRGPRDDIGNGRVPGFTAYGPDGDGEPDYPDRQNIVPDTP